MIGIVVMMHGHIAQALVESATGVLRGYDGKIVALGVQHGDEPAVIEQQLKAAIQSVTADGGVLILTDMFGGTPSNLGMTMHRAGSIEILTGASLPMVIKAMQLGRHPQTPDLTAVARDVKSAGERAMTIATDILGMGKSNQASGR